MSVLSTKYSVNSVEHFIESIENTKNNFYVFIAKGTPWGNTDTVAANSKESNNSIENTELDIYKDLSYGKRIKPEDVEYAIPRYNWANNTGYYEYDNQDGALYTKQFYIVTDDNNIYKCISNNSGNSTIKPTLRSTSIFETGDGYKWKYMYSINLNDAEKFNSNDYIVISANSTVTDAAIPGTIDNYKVTNIGAGYDATSNGYIVNFVNSQIVEISSNASSVDNIYTGSAIYLKSGLGAGQIRTITAYDGGQKNITVSPAFTMYVNIELDNITGTPTVDQIVTQKTEVINYLYRKGYFQEGDVVKQPRTGANGTVISANSTVLRVDLESSNNYVNSYPIFKTSDTGTLKTGTVTIANGQSNVTGSGTLFTTEYEANDYIRVGNSSVFQLGRIQSITNTTLLTVNTNFSTSLTANTHYKLSYAVEPSDVNTNLANGSIVYTNLSGVILSYSNTDPVGAEFLAGEVVEMVDGSDVSQGANGIVSFSNSTHVVLSDVSGTFTDAYYILGGSSAATAEIDAVEIAKSITVESNTLNFVSGQLIRVFDSFSNTSVAAATASANATNISITPEVNTEYVISPKVTVTGDGVGAEAYVEINSNNTIGNVVAISAGNNYTYASVSISANSEHGGNTEVRAIVSPTVGHGGHIIDELGARYAIISVNFDTFENESYIYPPYGQFRRVGLIKNPFFDDVHLTLENFERTQMTIANRSDAFTNNEVIYQTGTGAAGVAVYNNTTFLEIKSTSGTFEANNANDVITGLVSGSTANVKSFETAYFQTGTANDTLIVQDTGASGKLLEIVSNTEIRLSNVCGILSDDQYVYSPGSNAYANIAAISISNGNLDVTSNYGLRFSQLGRLSLSTNTAAYDLYETVVQGNSSSNVTATIIDTSHSIDLLYENISGSAFAVGQILTNSNTDSNGVITFANSTYLKVDAISNTAWSTGDSIINNIGTTADISNTYSVLTVEGVIGVFGSVNNNYITGSNSGAVGLANISNTTNHPDLTRNSGEVLYIENIDPFTKVDDSDEDFRLVLKF